ncbi:hypothetical protein BDB01DRAFT_854330 [Pilobolus umbonatus]|nr:hypothetical protein BDB01DRAFT_854330 [Pilobolus umbonatus]
MDICVSLILYRYRRWGIVHFKNTMVKGYVLIILTGILRELSSVNWYRNSLDNSNLNAWCKGISRLTKSKNHTKKVSERFWRLVWKHLHGNLTTGIGFKKTKNFSCYLKGIIHYFIHRKKINKALGTRYMV